MCFAFVDQLPHVDIMKGFKNENVMDTSDNRSESDILDTSMRCVLVTSLTLSLHLVTTYISSMCLLLSAQR